MSEVVRRRGSGNDPVQAQVVGDDDVTLMEVSRQDVGQMQSRYAAQARAEAQLPDARLGELLFSDGDVLAGMSFREAVNFDPRRVDALITQRVNRAFAPGGFLQSFDLRPELHRITAPTLLLAGRHDWICPPVFSEEIAALIPGAQLKVFEHSSHSLRVDEPDQLIAEVAAFTAN